MSKNPPVDAAARSGPAVIRRIEAAEESTRDRLVKKLLPAWVASGAVNVGIVLTGLLISSMFPPTVAKTSDSLIEGTAVKEPEETVVDPTNEDLGVDPSKIATNEDISRTADTNVESTVTADPIGTTDAPAADPAAFTPTGVGMTSEPGVVGEAGKFLTGGGDGGSQMGALQGRSGATKSQLVARGGGNADSEAAVARGLAWLARQQRPDGSWLYDGSEKEDSISATGLSLLPFLAAGNTHKVGVYQVNIKKGLEYLLRNLPVDGPSAGKFNSKSGYYMYVHGIATIALCEAYGMSKDKAFLQIPAQSAINFIQKAQAADGSWGYHPNQTGDTSIVGWQLQALKAAQLSRDLVVDDKVIKNAIKFLDAVSSGSIKSTYGYSIASERVGKPGTSRTAVGLLSRYYLNGWGPQNPAMSQGVEGLKTMQPTKASGKLGDMYFYYYATQVVHFFEGPDWRDWNEGPEVNGKRAGGMRDLLVSLQKPKADVANGGSWDPDGHWIGDKCGRLGTTCMCLLTLEVYYRHLPLYKRDSGAGKKLLGN